MVNNVRKQVNAGVHANVGMDFQRHCALFLLLEECPSILQTDFFISIENHDDIIFGFIDASGSLLKVIAYQAKKASTDWTMSQLYEILDNIITCGLSITHDTTVLKSTIYSQLHGFITNQPIALKIKEKGLGNKKNIEIGVVVNETNEDVSFKNLDEKIQDDFNSKLKQTYNRTDSELLYLNNLKFRHIDVARKSSSQKEQLSGKFRTVFGDLIHDHDAALRTLIEKFDEIDSTHNQGNTATLFDKSKRIESKNIKSIINVLETKQKAYEHWRRNGEKIHEILEVSVLEHSVFKLNFEDSFDLFKDLTQTEHRKILNFIKGRKVDFQNFYSDASCLQFLFTECKANISSQLTDLQLKAAIYAAYFETKDN